MNELTLTLKKELKIPIDGSIISPTSLNGKTIEEIKNLELWRGNRKVKMDKVFHVKGKSEGEEDNLTVRLVGDFSKARGLGFKMKGGTLVIDGNAGLRLGEKMSGGLIKVNGNAGSWLGSEMSGGTIEVEGNAGDFVGAGYRGGRKGMKGGKIMIKGSCGAEAGAWMINGVIKVYGNSGIFPGIHMKGGTIFVKGGCEGRAGAEMKDGKIVILGYLPSILPSFDIEEVKASVKVEEEKISGPFYLFTGDINEEGVGKLYVSINSNPQLKFWEKFLESVI
ncbi:formylmethanofuran dehydrogenase subunit C [Candidatus Bathyarchaeota archaeon]|nr:formylmethanofuran dehydrogenase subunit C [Candidatus Bathyarchaeota archaeon]